MRIKGTQDYLVKIGTIAVADIILNLFIFFFISFSLLFTFNSQIQSKIKTDLPSSGSSITRSKKQPLEVIIDSDNLIYVDGKTTKIEHLTSLVESKNISEIVGQQTLSILVRADKQATYDIVVRVIDAINVAGLPKVGLTYLNN